MVDKSKYTIEQVKIECDKCRILCKHCHLIHQTNADQVLNTKQKEIEVNSIILLYYIIL